MDDLRAQDQIKYMVDRFLGWKLPANFAPDAGISFKPFGHPASWPIGTNLFDATQAEAMVRYLIDGLPAAAPPSAPQEGLRIYQLFVLAAHWVLWSLQKDVEASEPAVLLYTPLKMAALGLLKAFQPPGTVRSFTGPEGLALSRLAAAAEASVPVPKMSTPLGGEAGEWWQMALKALDLPSIPWGRTMEYLRAATVAAPPPSAEKPAVDTKGDT